jgi:hypothetical protein
MTALAGAGLRVTPARPSNALAAIPANVADLIGRRLVGRMMNLPRCALWKPPSRASEHQRERRTVAGVDLDQGRSAVGVRPSGKETSECVIVCFRAGKIKGDRQNRSSRSEATHSRGTARSATTPRLRSSHSMTRQVSGQHFGQFLFRVSAAPRISSISPSAFDPSKLLLT